MTDLSEFGGGVDRAEADQADTDTGGFGDDHGYQYRTGRCRAIDTSGTRCSAPSTHGEPCCHQHGLDDRGTTIDDGPVALIEATTRTVWTNVENERVRAAVDRIQSSQEATDA